MTTNIKEANQRIQVRKNLVMSGVLENQVIRHKGDLTIEGDVPKGSHIEIEDGNLLVKGSIHQGAKIKLTEKNLVLSTQDEMFRDILNNFPFLFNLSGPCSVKNNTENTCLKSKNSYSTYQVQVFGNIDSGVEMNVSAILNIGGSVGQGSNITARYNIIAKDIDSEVTLYSQMGGVHIHNLSRGCVLLARDAITAHGLASGNKITVNMGRFKAASIGDNVLVNARDGIMISGNIGSGNQLHTTMGCIKAKAIGKDGKLMARDGIICGNVGENVVLQARMGNILAGNIGSAGKLAAKNGIQVGNVSAETTLSSGMGAISCKNIASGVSLMARDNINCLDLGDNVKVECRMGAVVVDNIGKNARIDARDRLTAKEVGKDSIINVKMGQALVGAQESGVSIHARDGVIRRNLELNRHSIKVS